MTKLTVLGSPFVNVYNDKELFVHIGYDNDMPPDASAFEQHGNNTIIPELRRHLFGSNYWTLKEMYYPDNSCLPAIVVIRQDAKAMTPQNIDEIKLLLTATIHKINQKNENGQRANPASVSNSASLFSSSSSAAAAAQTLSGHACGRKPG